MVMNTRVFALTQMSCKSELMSYFEVASWPLCTAFQLDELVFVNVSEGSHYPPEFAVIQAGQHLANLPLARLSRQAVSERIDRLLADTESLSPTVCFTFEPADHHRCTLCADWVWGNRFRTDSALKIASGSLSPFPKCNSDLRRTT